MKLDLNTIILPEPESYLVFKEYDGIDYRWICEEAPPSIPKTPSDWFAHHFPGPAKKYGPPILERRFLKADGFEAVKPVSINEDFMAAILAHERCGRIIFYTPEGRWYRYNPEEEYFELAEEEHLKLALSQQFIKCTQDMRRSIEIEPLLTEFREDELLNRIIRRSKAVIAKDQSFFNDESGNRRSPVLSPEEAARVFVDECLEEDENGYVTIKECIQQYTNFSRSNGYPVLPRIGFTEMISEAVRRRYNRSLRCDLLTLGADHSRGFKGVRWKSADV